MGLGVFVREPNQLRHLTAASRRKLIRVRLISSDITLLLRLRRRQGHVFEAGTPIPEEGQWPMKFSAD